MVFLGALHRRNVVSNSLVLSVRRSRRLDSRTSVEHRIPWVAERASHYHLLVHILHDVLRSQ